MDIGCKVVKAAGGDRGFVSTNVFNLSLEAKKHREIHMKVASAQFLDFRMPPSPWGCCDLTDLA